MRYLIYVSLTVSLLGCKADGNYPGVEYSPQMYHSVGYEPLSQITPDGIASGILESNYYVTNSLPYNDYQGKTPINMKEPVAGTVKRQYNPTVNTGKVTYTIGDKLLFYNLHKDSIEMASATLKNPLPQTDEVVERGKELYTQYCYPCHGEKGDGNGKVGKVYKGVPNYATGRYATMTEGHIFHVITHGKGRMWSHKGQISPEDRWKIVRYVQQLQKGA